MAGARARGRGRRVVALTAVNYVGVQKSALLTRVIVAVVLAVLAAVVVVVARPVPPTASPVGVDDAIGLRGVLQAAGLLFFAFAGYARIATLGEEVRDPATTIPRAIPSRWASRWSSTRSVAIAVLAVLGSAGLASATRAARRRGARRRLPGLVPVVRVGAAVAALGSLLALILGVSRTTLAMARDRHLPHALAAVHPRFAHPAPCRTRRRVASWRVLAAIVDLRGAIGFSSFAVLVYYAIANAGGVHVGPQGDSGARPRRMRRAGGLAAARLGMCRLGVVLLGAACSWSPSVGRHPGYPIRRLR